MIIDVRPSPLKYKRYRATILKHNGEEMKIDFGYFNANTFIDNRTKRERENYLKRHLANKKEKYLVENLILSPALLSIYLLWGPTKSLEKNVELLNELWKEKHG